MKQPFTQRELNLVNDTKDISSDKFLSLPETISLPSTPWTISQFSTTLFPLNFPLNLDDRIREHVSNNIPPRLDGKTFVAHSPLLGRHPGSHRWHNWVLNILQYRHDIHKDIQEHNIQILVQDTLTVKIEDKVKLRKWVHHPLCLPH